MPAIGGAMNGEEARRSGLVHGEGVGGERVPDAVGPAERGGLVHVHVQPVPPRGEEEVCDLREVSFVGLQREAATASAGRADEPGVLGEQGAACLEVARSNGGSQPRWPVLVPIRRGLRGGLGGRGVAGCAVRIEGLHARRVPGAGVGVGINGRMTSSDSALGSGEAMTNVDDEPEYILGTGDDELARLDFQHQVWKDLCIGALERAGVGEGQRVLDLGCGPGFAASEIARMVGRGGAVSLLDESPRWHRILASREFEAPTVQLETTIEDAALEPGAHDVVYSRWLMSFLPDIDSVCRKVLDTLRPGGSFVVQDYNHDGVAVFPRSEGFEAVVRAARAFYVDAGGDAWVATRLPAALRRAGFVDVEVRPHVKAGGPGSGVFRWVGAFFRDFSEAFVARGLMTMEERALFLSEWAVREADPDALFFSPMVVEVSARRPG